MAYSTRKSVLLMLACVTLLSILAQQQVEADVLEGSCVWGGSNYMADCAEDCKKRGYKGGHCGSFWNVNCWCET